MSRWDTQSPEQVSVNRICTQLHQAYRALRLYPVDHPSARQAIDGLLEAVGSHVNELGSLVLQVEENRLLYDGEQVYSFAGSRDNLAFLLFRDGIRSLSFFTGLEEAELGTFVNCLAHADDLAAIEHDLSTAFWEQDFVHIDYQVVDPFLAGEVLREGTVDVLRETVLRRLDEVKLTEGQPVDQPGGALSTVELLAFEPASLTLTQTEMEQSERTVAEGSDALDDFVVVLLEIACDDSRASDDDPALVRSLATVVDHHLENGDLDALNRVLGRLRMLERDGRRHAGFVEAVVGEAVTTRRLGALLERGSEAKTEEAARIDQFLAAILPGALPVLLELLVETEDRAVRKTLLAALEMQDWVPGSYIWPLMQDARWYVVRNAVQLMAGSPDPELSTHLERLLRHTDTRVRREVVRTLDTLGGSRSVPALLKALEDEDSSVRILAARSLGRHGGADQQEAMQAHLVSGSLDARPSEEIEAFALAFAALGGDKAVPVLDSLWRRRHLRARALPVRVAALQALAALSSPEAAQILTEATQSRETPVRQAATRALRESQALRMRRRS